MGVMTLDLRELSRPEYEATLRAPMRDVTSTAEEVVDLWPYAERALREAFPQACNCDLEVGYVYEAADGSYQHILVPSHESNVYLVVIVDKEAKAILGHYRLNLGALYGVEP